MAELIGQYCTLIGCNMNIHSAQLIFLHMYNWHLNRIQIKFVEQFKIQTVYTSSNLHFKLRSANSNNNDWHLHHSTPYATDWPKN